MFKKDFAWGTATASYQIEGAAFEDGRGMSVWDAFSADGKCKFGHTGEVACDHYHRYEEDIKLMKELGTNAYRFSISWTRILPKGVGEVNEKGIAFYNRLIDCLIENGITPYVTLFHWDYPLELEIRGNWSNPDSPKWFEEYAKVVFKAFGDRVKHFITFNEPQCFIGHGYGVGVHAPGTKCQDRDLVLKSHHMMLAHGLAVQAFREIVPDGKIGYAPTASPAIPASDSKEDIEAARKRYFDVKTKGDWTWNVSWFSDPIILGKYPEDTEAYNRLSQYLPEGYREDLKIISQPIDFYCQNIYNGFLYRATEQGGEELPHSMRTAYTSMRWPITPASLYWGPKFLYERYGLPIIISENGMAAADIVSADGHIHDAERITFVEQYLEQLEKAADDGVDVAGYMYWSFLDNFEWGEGYTQRFGLVYVDYETQERIPKDSYYWYRDFIQSRK